MRIDKYLKVSRIIKRRTIAKQYLDNGLIKINDKISKASSPIFVNDIILINKKDGIKKYRVLCILEYATEEKAKLMYEEITD